MREIHSPITLRAFYLTSGPGGTGIGRSTRTRPGQRLTCTFENLDHLQARQESTAGPLRQTVRTPIKAECQRPEAKRCFLFSAMTLAFAWEFRSPRLQLQPAGNAIRTCVRVFKRALLLYFAAAHSSEWAYISSIKFSDLWS